MWHRNKLGARREKEKGKAHDNVEKISRRGTETARVELMGGNEDDRSRPRKVEDLCKGPMRDEAQGG